MRRPIRVAIVRVEKDCAQALSKPYRLRELATLATLVFQNGLISAVLRFGVRGCGSF